MGASYVAIAVHRLFLERAKQRDGLRSHDKVINWQSMLTPRGCVLNLVGIQVNKIYDSSALLLTYGKQIYCCTPTQPNYSFLDRGSYS